MAITKTKLIPRDGKPITYITSEAIAAGLAVKLETGGTVGIADTAASDIIIGICVEATASGLGAPILCGGICKALAGTAINEGEALTCEDGGRVVDTTTTGDYLVGRALSDAEDGEYFEIQVMGHVRYAATT